jgi:hypothetical protein
LPPTRRRRCVCAGRQQRWPLIALIGAAISGHGGDSRRAPADLMAQTPSCGAWATLCTDQRLPSPPPQSYVTDQSIKADVEAPKRRSDYLERRYRCDDEDSEYHVTLRHTRVQ